jgi:hypothetical protein
MADAAVGVAKPGAYPESISALRRALASGCV